MESSRIKMYCFFYTKINITEKHQTLNLALYCYFLYALLGTGLYSIINFFDNIFPDFV